MAANDALWNERQTALFISIWLKSLPGRMPMTADQKLKALIIAAARQAVWIFEVGESIPPADLKYALHFLRAWMDAMPPKVRAIFIEAMAPRFKLCIALYLRKHSSVRLDPVAVDDALRLLEAGHSLDFLRAEARRRTAQLRETMLLASGVGPTTSMPTPADIQRMFYEALANGRRYVRRVPLPEALVPRRDLWDGVRVCCDLDTAFDAADLSVHARRIAYARMRGITRDEAPGRLGMSEREVQAACKELNRKAKSILHVMRDKKV